MSDNNKINAVIKVQVYPWQIGREASVYFPDTMMVKGVCEIDKDNPFVMCGNKTEFSAFPPECDYCQNNPKNGGTGICNCTLATPKIMC